MREIKYRVWNTISKIMKPFSEIKRCGVFAIADGLNSDDFIILPLKNSILNEYTGLKDKNGVEIYEGDIVKYDFNKLNYRIEFVNAEFIARRFYENIENLYPTEFDYGKECEVIGNIYENPELLEFNK